MRRSIVATRRSFDVWREPNPDYVRPFVIQSIVLTHRVPQFQAFVFPRCDWIFHCVVGLVGVFWNVHKSYNTLSM